jgi:hypothetical protein
VWRCRRFSAKDPLNSAFLDGGVLYRTHAACCPASHPPRFEGSFLTSRRVRLFQAAAAFEPTLIKKALTAPQWVEMVEKAMDDLIGTRNPHPF